MLNIDPLTILAFGVGIVALVLAVKRERSRPAAPVLDKEQELLEQIASLKRDIAGLQRMLVEKQREIDALSERIRQLERGAAPMDEPVKARRVLLVGVGDQEMLQDDLAQLRRVQQQTDIRISRLLPVSMASLVRTLDRHRASGNPVRLLHLATHSNPQGLLFTDGLATGRWLSEHLAGVEIAVLAGCRADQVADLLGVVPAVVSMREDVDNKSASIFAGAFWLAVGLGMDVNEAFERALQRAPALVGEFVELHL